MKNYTLFVILMLCTVGYAQRTTYGFGEISGSEIDLQSYEKDPKADAVVLFDVGKSEFVKTLEGDYDIQFTRHRRVKIFNKSALEHSKVTIHFYEDGFGRTERIDFLEAVTYNYENGKLVKHVLKPEHVYEEQVSEKWKAKKFTFPNVQEGSIIEFKYVLETPFHFNLPDWEFQSRIPTVYSQYEVRMIPFYDYVYTAQGISKFDYHHSYVDSETRQWGTVSKVNGQNVGNGVEFKDAVHVFAMEDVDAFKDETYITSINDYIIKIDFQLSKFFSPYGGAHEIMSTWPDLKDRLLRNDHFGKYEKKCERLAKNVLEEMSLEELSEEEKCRKIIDYVKQGMEWNGRSSKYAEKSAKEFFGSKSGNSAEINLFMLAMLRVAGIKADPVILSTRSHGKIKTSYPFDHLTNYVVVLVDIGETFLADGTESLLPFDWIPSRCLNDKGLIVSKSEEVNWVHLRGNHGSVEKDVVNMSIDPETKDANVMLTVHSMGYAAHHYRDAYHDDKTELTDNFSKLLGEDVKVKTIGYSNSERPYSMGVEGILETDKVGSNLVVNPFLNLAFTQNELTAEKRTYPVDIVYPLNQEFDVTLLIPQGYRVVDLPKSLKLDNDQGMLEVFYELTDSELKITGKYGFKKAVYDPDEYHDIRKYIDLVVRKFNEKVVLEKVGA